MVNKIERTQRERNVIANIIATGDLAMNEALRIGVDESWFNAEANIKMWKEVLRLHNDNLSISPQLIRGIDKDSLTDYLSRTSFDVNNSREYLKQLKEVKQFDDLEIKFLEIRKYRETGDIDSAVSEISQMVDNMLETGRENEKDLKSIDVINKMLDFYDSDLSLGIHSGYKQLDNHMMYENGELSIIAARPAMGKSAFSLGITRNFLNSGKAGAFISLEMPYEQVFFRMMGAEAKIPVNDLKNKRDYYNLRNLKQLCKEGKQDTKQDQFMKAVKNFSKWKLNIIDETGIRVSEIKCKLRKLKRNGQLDFAIIDYLQLIRGDKKSYTNINEEVQEISRELKGLAKELGVPIIALAQLSRAVEQRADRRPILSDLRDSGSIEQDAAVVQFLYRDEYYNSETEFKNIIEVITAKNRNGATSMGLVKFYGETQLIAD